MVLVDVYRFSYVTQSDKQAVATARLAVPVSGPAQYDVVTHLHGTIGFADHCAPSKLPGFGFESPLNPIPADMVADGRVVVMPDYPGLGVPGRHRYIEKESTGRSVWDSLEAAKRVVSEHYPDRSATGQLLVMGHSQGGHATLATLATQRDTDPWNVVGAVAFAPPGDPVEHAAMMVEGDARAAPFAWALMSYAQAYPDDLAADLVFEGWVHESLPGMMHDYCAPALTVWLGGDPDAIFTADAMEMFTRRQPSAGMARVVERERLDHLQTQVPIRIYHGTSDTLLPHKLSQDLAQRLTENGNDVEWRAVEGAGHLSVPYKVRCEVAMLANQRFGGAAPRL
jgi:pimeloyl-ACP methyl ester carboxylesterase